MHDRVRLRHAPCNSQDEPACKRIAGSCWAVRARVCRHVSSRESAAENRSALVPASSGQKNALRDASGLKFDGIESEVDRYRVAVSWWARQAQVGAVKSDRRAQREHGASLESRHAIRGRLAHTALEYVLVPATSRQTAAHFRASSRRQGQRCLFSASHPLTGRANAALSHVHRVRARSGRAPMRPRPLKATLTGISGARCAAGGPWRAA